MLAQVGVFITQASHRVISSESTRIEIESDNGHDILLILCLYLCEIFAMPFGSNSLNFPPSFSWNRIELVLDLAQFVQDLLEGDVVRFHKAMRPGINRDG